MISCQTQNSGEYHHCWEFCIIVRLKGFKGHHMNVKVPRKGKDKQETEKGKREEASDDHCHPQKKKKKKRCHRQRNDIQKVIAKLYDTTVTQK